VVPRLFTLVQEGPGTVRVGVVGGQESKELCLWPGEPDDRPDRPTCRTVTRGGIEVTAAGAGATTWTASVTGEGSFPTPVDVRLSFASEAPVVTIDGFRFQGSLFPESNGFVARCTTPAAGEMAVDGRIRGGSTPFRLRVDDVGEDETVDEVTGTGDRVSYDVELPDASEYLVSLGNDAEFANEELFLRATLRWP
jgi:hypothetical protein